MIPNCARSNLVSICLFMHVQCWIGKAGCMHWIWNTSLRTTSNWGIAQKWNLPNYLVEEKNAADFRILIGNARLSWTHAQCLLGRYGSSDRDWLQSSPGELRHLNSFVLKTDTTAKQPFWIISSIKKGLQRKLFRSEAQSIPCEIALSRGSAWPMGVSQMQSKYALCLDILKTWFLIIILVLLRNHQVSGFNWFW